MKINWCEVASVLSHRNLEPVRSSILAEDRSSGVSRFSIDGQKLETFASKSKELVGGMEDGVHRSRRRLQEISCPRF